VRWPWDYSKSPLHTCPHGMVTGSLAVTLKVSFLSRRLQAEDPLPDLQKSSRTDFSLISPQRFSHQRCSWNPWTNTAPFSALVSSGLCSEGSDFSLYSICTEMLGHLSFHI
jgi:hypothetical protein